MASEDLEPLRGRADFKALVAEQLRKAPAAPPAGSRKAEAVAVSDPTQHPAAAALARSAPAQENQAAAQHAIGLVLLDGGRLDAAAEHLGRAFSVRERLVQGQPESLVNQIDLAATLVGLARLDQKAGRSEPARQWWKQAASLLTRVVAQRPDDRQSWKDLGLVHAELGEPEAAAAYARFLDLTPESRRVDALIDLATVHKKAGRLEESRRWWGKVLPIRAQAVAQRPDDLQAWKDLGIAQAGLGQSEAATTAFAKVLELTPETNDTRRWYSPDRAGIGAALADHDDVFGRLVEARPRDRNLLIARFHFFGRRRRWQEAAEIAARVVELDPKDANGTGVSPRIAAIRR